MTAKSIAARATAFRQRHTRIAMKSRLNNETEININTQHYECRECHAKRWFKFVRCPECQILQ